MTILEIILGLVCLVLIVWVISLIWELKHVREYLREKVIENGELRDKLNKQKIRKNSLYCDYDRDGIEKAYKESDFDLFSLLDDDFKPRDYAKKPGVTEFYGNNGEVFRMETKAERREKAHSHNKNRKVRKKGGK